MSTRHLPIIPLMLLIVWAASCNKTSNTPAPAPLVAVTAKIATVQIVSSDNDTAKYSILYNAQGQVDSIIEISPGSTQYQYTSFVYSSNNSYTVIINDGGGPETETITTNADGTINSVIEDTYDTFSYTYNSNGITQTSEGNNITHYIWVSGDIDSSFNPSSVFSSTIYYYDLSHLWQMGDIISIGDFLSYGRPTIKSKHLMTGRSFDSDLEKYTYKFDSQSRITQLAIPDDNVIYKYTYTN
jgi:hypothetical protein